MLALGTVAAVLASALFSVGLLLQAAEARTVALEDNPFAALGRLVRRRRWLLGVLAMAAGFLFHVSALLFAPLTVVQPSLAAGLLVLLAYSARVEHETVGRRELLGVLAITLGVVALTLTGPQRTTLTAGAGLLALALGGLGLLALAPQLLAWRSARPLGSIGLVATVSAGAAYSLTGLTTKLVSDSLDAGDWLAVALWLALTVVVALLALVDQTTALRHRPATQVGVVIYVMPVVIPVVLAPLLFGEGWGSSSSGPVLIVLSVLAVTAGAALLAASRGVSGVEASAAAR